MNAQNNAARVAVPAEPCQDVDEQALDVHALFQERATCGYDRDLTLAAHEVQYITARLRGIGSISALLIAAGDRNEMKLSEWMESGLTEALHALAEDAQSILDSSNERSRKGR